ncbi:MAG TPA: NUDIX hydrolase [Vicinamibacterales bacterium]|jgi:ADP-ribose pyrophosphatase
MPIVYKGRVFSVSEDRVRLPKGGEITMEAVRHPGSVVMLAMPDPDHIILVRQYRYVIDRWIWELPAGTLHGGETPEAAAVRECAEETGLLPDQVERLGTFYPSPGICDEVMTFFRATGLTPAAPGSAVQDEDEDLEPKTLALDEVRAMIRRGEIPDMKTIAGMALLRD